MSIRAQQVIAVAVMDIKAAVDVLSVGAVPAPRALEIARRGIRQAGALVRALDSLQAAGQRPVHRGVDVNWADNMAAVLRAYEVSIGDRLNNNQNENGGGNNNNDNDDGNNEDNQNNYENQNENA